MESSSNKALSLNEESTQSDFVAAVDMDSSSKRYAEVFPVEVECWCYGIANFPGELYPKLVHRVIKEMAPTFRASIDNGYVFDVFDTGNKIFKSCRGILPEKQIIFSILANLPMPFELDEESQFVLAQIIDQVEQTYGGVIEQMEAIWKRERIRRKVN